MRPNPLAALSDPSEAERAILSACGYSANDVWLHRDPALMPKRKAAWAAWNFLREGDDGDRRVAVSYWMNRLQSIDEAKPLFVTLNPPFEPRPDLTFGRFSYDHPQFDGPALAARKRLDEIQGVNRTWYCGAWTRHGFHEDGLSSGLTVAARLGCEAPWRKPSTPLAHDMGMDEQARSGATIGARAAQSRDAAVEELLT